ncbi:helix-turn-helix domain-containing protein [Nocardia sp. NPDC001965]
MIDTGELLASLTQISELVEENERLRQENQQLKSKPSNQKKLSPKEVAEIRRLYRTARSSYRELAGIYDVHPATIGRIIQRVYHK